MTNKTVPLNLDIKSLVEIDLNNQDPETRDVLLDYIQHNPRDRLVQRDNNEPVKVWLTAPKLKGLMLHAKIRF